MTLHLAIWTVFVFAGGMAGDRLWQRYQRRRRIQFLDELARLPDLAPPEDRTYPPIDPAHPLVAALQRGLCSTCGHPLPASGVPPRPRWLVRCLTCGHTMYPLEDTA